MKRPTLVLVPCLGILLTLAVPSINAEFHDGTGSKAAHRAWTVSWSVGVLPTEQDPPAILVSTRGDLKDGVVISAGSLKNASDKTISAVRIGWNISETSAPKRVLASGKTGPVGVTSFTPGTVATIDKPVVSVADALSSYAKKSPLRGKYHVSLAIVHVQFADGTEWTQVLPGA